MDDNLEKDNSFNEDIRRIIKDMLERQASLPSPAEFKYACDMKLIEMQEQQFKELHKKKPTKKQEDVKVKQVPYQFDIKPKVEKPTLLKRIIAFIKYEKI